MKSPDDVLHCADVGRAVVCHGQQHIDVTDIALWKFNIAWAKRVHDLTDYNKA